MIEGRKGGESKPRPAREAPDSLISISYAKILDFISEGEIVGLVNGPASIFLDETPLYNSEGQPNFSGVTYSERKGTQDQSYIEGFPSVESENAVGVELRTDLPPYTRAINNVQLSAIRVRVSTPRLAQTNPENGDTNGYRIDYAIDLSVSGGEFQTVITTALDGKTTSEYNRSHRVDLPLSTSGWTLRVRRLTPNRNDQLFADTMFIQSVTEIIDAKFRYPNSALVGIEFDASQFQNIPPRSFHMKGRIVRVPSNYDPVARTYSGVWDGTFKLAYTNCPPWIYYDILLNDRYGLGHLLNQSQVDKWELYRIAQYCDEMVPNGQGGTEPRFTCNVYLQQRADALRVLQDLASTFRGMSFWGGGLVYSSCDMPSDPQYTYTNANVIDGQFNYPGSDRKSRISSVLVSWNDMKDFCRAKVEYVEDRESLARYGHRQQEIKAFGCTSQSMAQRLGRWMLLTNRLETETVTFSVGLDGVLVSPGSIIRIADNHRAGRRIGGRIRDVTLNSAVLDADVEVNPGDLFTVILPNGRAVSRTISRVGYPLTWDNTGITWDDGSLTMDTTGFPELVQQVTFDPPLEFLPAKNSIWAIDSKSLATQQFKVVSIREDFNEEKMEFQVTATKHVPGKYELVDTGTRIEQPPVTVIPPSVQAPVTNIQVTSDYLVDQGQALTTMSVTWDAPVGAVAYEVYWRMNNGDWAYAGRTGATRIEVKGILSGRYLVRVQAFNSLGIGSLWANSGEVVLQGKTSPPPVVSFLRVVSKVQAMTVQWGFPTTLDVETTAKTELWYSMQPDLSTALKMGDYSYPNQEANLVGMGNGVRIYFWVRLVDKIGNIGAFSQMATGITSFDATNMLELLDGQLTESQLAESLLERIDGGGELATDIQQIKSELAAAITLRAQGTRPDGSLVVGGVGVGVEPQDGELISRVILMGDQVSIVQTVNGVMRSLFVAENGNLVLGPTFISKLTVQEAMVGSTIKSTSVVPSGPNAGLPVKEDNYESGVSTNRGVGFTRVDNSSGMKLTDVSTGVVVLEWGDL